MDMVPYLGVICVVLSWLAGAYMLRRWRGTHDMSISLHAASARGAYVIFASVLTLGGGLFMFFLYSYFMPKLRLGSDFGALLALAFAGQVIAAWVPDSTNLRHWRSRVHKSAAWFMAVLFIPMALFITASPYLSLVARTIDVACVGYMIGAFTYWILSRNKTKFLIHQVLYIIAFQICILASAYS